MERTARRIRTLFSGYYIIPANYIFNNATPIGDDMFFDQLSPEAIGLIKYTLAQTNVAIHIDPDTGAGSIRAETPRLIIRTTEAADVELYNRLFDNQAVMDKYADGQLLKHASVSAERRGVVNYAENMLQNPRHGVLSDWERGDLLGMMTVELKDTGEKLGGFTLVPYNGKKEVEEISALMLPEYWDKKYGSEAAIVYLYAILPQVILSGHLKNIPERIISRVQQDHIVCQKLLEKMGFIENAHLYPMDKDPDDANKKFYFLEIQDIMKAHHQLMVLQQIKKDEKAPDKNSNTNNRITKKCREKAVRQTHANPAFKLHKKQYQLRSQGEGHVRMYNLRRQSPQMKKLK